MFNRVLLMEFIIGIWWQTNQIKCYEFMFNRLSAFFLIVILFIS